MGLPRKSVCGFPVIEHVDFAKEVISYDEQTISDQINLGNVFNMGSVCGSKVFLDKESLSMHTFVTGSTGSAIMCNYKFDMENGIAVVFENEKFSDIGKQDIIL